MFIFELGKAVGGLGEAGDWVIADDRRAPSPGEWVVYEDGAGTWRAQAYTPWQEYAAVVVSVIHP